MSNPNPPAAAAPASRRLRWLGFGALAADGVFIAVHASAVAGGSDSSGYLNSARLLPSGRLLADLRGPAGAIYFHPGFPVLRWDQIDARGFARYAALARQSGRPVCALLFDAEENEALQTRCPGRWTRLARVRNAGLWQLDDDLGAPAR